MESNPRAGTGEPREWAQSKKHWLTAGTQAVTIKRKIEAVEMIRRFAIYFLSADIILQLSPSAKSEGSVNSRVGWPGTRRTD
jgi:hypothetical protein